MKSRHVLVVAALLVVARASVGQVTITLTPASSTDDVSERGSNGTIFDADPVTHRATNNGNNRRHAGIRFLGATIPSGATIDSASLQLYIPSASFNAVRSDIYLEASDSPATFSTAVTADVSSRTRGAQSVFWDATGLVSSTYVALDVTALVQERVNAANWQSGDPIAVLMIAPSSNPDRELRFSAYGSANPARLVITYSVPVPPGPATNLTPANGATGQNINVDLSWSAGTNASTHTVRFGTSSPPPQVASGIPLGTTTYDPGALAPNTAYFWRIDEVNSFGTATGPEWSFTTAPAPGQASSPVPAHTQTNVPTTQILSWTAGSNTTSHDVHFGTAPNPPFVGNQVGTSYNPGALSQNQTYYWRIDEVGPGGTTTGVEWRFTTVAPGPPGLASNPSPADTATNVAVSGTTLSWTAGVDTLTHTIRFGTSSPPPQVATGVPVGTTTYNPGALTPNTTYFWRIDEVNAVGTTTGTEWRFTTAPLPGQATNPDPSHGATMVPVDQQLSWTAGSAATSHHVRFGTAPNPPLVSTQAGTTYNPGVLANNQTYYWRIDEIGPGGTTTGVEWSFTTIPASVVEIVNYIVEGGNNDADELESTGAMTVAGAIHQARAASGAFGASVRRHGASRFTNVAIPKGANVVSATYSVYVDSPSRDDVRASVYVAANDVGSGAFSTTNFDITSRTRTAAFSSWDGTALGTGYKSVDVTTVVQERINAADWNSGDSLVVIAMAATDIDRRLEYRTENNGAGLQAPTLSVQYTLPAPGKATNPNPANGATDVLVSASLSWTANELATGHRVYLDTVNPPAALVATLPAATTGFDPGGLAQNTTYYWRVDETNNAGAFVTTGDVWSFTTEDIPGAVVISASGPAVANTGQTIAFTYSVINDGSVGDGLPLSNVSVSNNFGSAPAYQSGDDGDNLLEVGETWVYQSTYTVLATDSDPLVNIATVNALDSGAIAISDNDSHSVDINYTPAFTVVKSGPAAATVGTVVTYSISVSNNTVTGDGSPIGGVSVADSVAGPAAFIGGDDGDGLLEMGETWLFQASYTITATSPDPLNNTATASGTDRDGEAVSGNDSHSLDVLFAPVMSVVKLGPASAPLGSPVTYTILVSNSATGDGSRIAGLSVVDNVAGAASYISGDDGDGLLEAGETWQFQVSHTPLLGDPDPLINTATATGLDRDGDTITANNSHTMDIQHAPVLKVVKSGPASATPGQLVTYTFAVSHDTSSDNSPVSGVTVTDNVTGAAAYQSGDDGDGKLEAGETWLFSDTYTVTGAEPDFLVNTATASGLDLDGDPVSANDSHSLDVLHAPAVKIVKTGPSSANVGSSVAYVFSVTNDTTAGDGAPIVNVSVTDNIAGAAAYTGGDSNANNRLEPGETWTFTVSRTVLVSDPNPLVNIGTVNAADLDGDPLTDSDTHSMAVIASPPAQASNPNPVNGAINVALNATLSWTPGGGSTSTTVRFGTSSPPPIAGAPSGPGTFTPGALAANTTYYWRIDEANAFGATTGVEWSFTTIPPAPGKATNPSPTNGATGQALATQLSWTTGAGADTYNVYFGTSFPPAFAGAAAGTSFSPGILAPSTVYHWRVDSVNGGGANVTTGDAWSFTTAAAPPGEKILLKVDYAEDDAYQRDSDGEVFASAPELRLRTQTTSAAKRHMAARFRGANIPAGSVISQAIFSGYVFDPLNDDIAGNLYAELSDNPDPFADSPNSAHITNRVRSASSRAWDALNVGVGYASVDVTNLISEVVAAPTWDPDDPIVIIGLGRTAAAQSAHFMSYEGDPNLTCTLEITFMPPLPGKATNPSPANGSVNVFTNANLSWSAGAATAWHVVYLDTVNPPLTQVAARPVGVESYIPGELNSDTTYYWRVDEINAAGVTTGDVWTFTTGHFPPEKATLVAPSNGATDVPLNQALSWIPGEGAVSQTVYFDTVNPPANSLGSPAGNSVSPPLQPVTTYYWRVDGTNGAGTTQGDVWSFTTRDYRPVLNVVKTGPARASIGETVSYTIDISHNLVTGDGTRVTNVSVTDSLAGVAAFVSGDLGIPGALESGETWRFSVSYTVQASDLGLLANTATVTGRDLDNDVITASGGHTTAVARIHLTAPNGGETFPRDTDVPITWETEGAYTGDVRISLYKGGALVRDLASRVANSGAQSWRIPLGEPLGADYRIRVSDPDYPAWFDASDGDFSIIPAKPGQASNPSPGHGASNVPMMSVLTWTAGAGANTHKIYFGVVSPPPYVADAAAGAESYDPGPLTVATTYYWRIDEENGSGVTPGVVWSFTIEAGFVWGELSGDGKDGPYDAALIKQWKAGIIDRFPIDTAIVSPDFPPAGDVSADGVLGTVDASLILQKKVRLISTYPADLNGDGLGPDLVKKDRPDAKRVERRTAALAAPLEAAQGEEFAAHLLVDDTTDVVGVYFEVIYDPTAIVFLGVNNGYQTREWDKVTYQDKNGLIRGVLVGTAAPEDTGDVAALRFAVNDAGGLPLGHYVALTRIELNDGQIPVEIGADSGAPVITSIEPGFGPEFGGVAVTINGLNLADTQSVSFGGEASDWLAVSPDGTSVVALAPPGAGIVGVELDGLGGAAILPDAFEYITPTLLLSVDAPESAAAGETFTVNVAIEAQGPVAVREVTFTLSFDPRRFAVAASTNPAQPLANAAMAFAQLEGPGQLMVQVDLSKVGAVAGEVPLCGIDLIALSNPDDGLALAGLTSCAAINARGAAISVSGLPAFTYVTVADHTDADGDGLPDVTEAQLGTAPDNVDTDGDGLFDSAELAHGLDPLNPGDAN